MCVGVAPIGDALLLDSQLVPLLFAPGPTGTVIKSDFMVNVLRKLLSSLISLAN